MIAAAARINLLLAWLWVVAGIAFGFFLGTNFHRDDWLGGYTSFKRRLYRLAHISFFGLAIINLLFYFTVRLLPVFGGTLELASWGCIVGALTMPACCFLVAHVPRLRPVFLIPVLSLLTSSVLTFLELLKS